jgi:hypothetical protein
MVIDIKGEDNGLGKFPEGFKFFGGFKVVFISQVTTAIEADHDSKIVPVPG